MKKYLLQDKYDEIKEKEHVLDNKIINCENELKRLKIQNKFFRVKVNIIISSIILLISATSNLFRLISSVKILNSLFISGVFLLSYNVANLSYKFGLSKKYNIDLFKDMPESERLNKEIKSSIKLEQAKSKKNITSTTTNYLASKIRQCYNGIPLFSKYRLMDLEELKNKIENSNKKIKEENLELSKNIEIGLLNKLAKKYCLMNVFFKTLLNIFLGEMFILSLPVLMNFAISSVFQLLLSITFMWEVIRNSVIDFKNNRNVFRKYNIDLVSFNMFKNMEKYDSNILTKNNNLSHDIIDNIDASIIYDSIKEDQQLSKIYEKNNMKLYDFNNITKNNKENEVKKYDVIEGKKLIKKK